MQRDGDKMANRRFNVVRLLIIFWAIVAAAIIVYYVVIGIMRHGKVGVMIKCTPYISQVTIDGESVQNNAMIYLPEGGYEFECFLQEFETKKQKINVTNDVNVVVLNLLPTTEEGERIMNEHINDYYDADEYFLSKEGLRNDDTKYDEKEQKITKVLPFTTDNYGIGTLLEDDNFLVTITAFNSQYTQMAINQLFSLAKEAGVSIADYNVRINNFNNRLGSFVDNNQSSIETYLASGYQGVDLQVKNTGTTGGYHYALIMVKQDSGGKVIYRALLTEENGKFNLVATPYPILTTSNTVDVDINTLNYVNDLRVVTVQE